MLEGHTLPQLWRDQIPSFLPTPTGQQTQPQGRGLLGEETKLSLVLRKGVMFYI